MSTPATSFDPTRRLDLYFRIKRVGSKKFVFTNAAGTAIDISGYSFALYVKEFAGARTNIISLTVGSGLTVGGSGSNELTASFTVANTNIAEAEYYWELYKGSTSKTYLAGKAFAHNGLFDGVDEDTNAITITDETDTVTITLSDGMTSAQIVSALAYTPDNVKGVTASGTDTYTATYVPAPTAYATGQRFTIIFTNANTGAATLNLNGLGAKDIKKGVSTALSSGDIAAGEAVELVYDGTNFQIIGDGSGAGTVTASNGLTRTGDDIALGGTLTGSGVDIAADNKPVNFTDLSRFLISGNNGMFIDLNNAAGSITLSSPLFGGIITVSDNGVDLSGDVTATTQTAGNNSTLVATTAFVTTAADAKVADAINNNTTDVAPSQNAVFDALALKANLAGPTFTGTVILPSTTSIGSVSSTEIGYVDGVTSAIQTQLDAKVPTTRTIAGLALSSNITATELNDALKASRTLYINNASQSLTGTTSETITESLLIPGGTLEANDVLRITAVFTKSGTAGTLRLNIKVNTSASLVSASTIGTHNSGVNTTVYNKIEREVVFKNSVASQEVAANGVGGNSDVTSSTNTITTLSDDYATDKYLIMSMQLSNSGDTGTLRSWYVEILRAS